MEQDATDSEMGRRRATARGSRNAGYQDRRAEIITAAGKLFKARGYRGVSLADIAREVGTDRASLYYYFGSKEELFDSVVTELVVANLRDAERIRDSASSAPDKLRDLVVGLMVSFAEHYPFYYVYLQENMAHVAEKRQAWAERMRQLNHRYESAVQSIVEQGIEEGTLRPLIDPQVLAFGVMGIVNWTNRWFNPARSAVDAREIGEAYAELLIRGLHTTVTPA